MTDAIFSKKAEKNSDGNFVAKLYPYGVETVYIYEPGSESYVIVERHTRSLVSGLEFFHSLERDLNLESIQE
ncbi:hypothetical protein [Desulfosporosinus sp. OT]|uniref:hypothetical protein n=1 Tax=Desulfosporosinus sp. OT TaxID=913865 RepID=UPI000223B234|nr:hypothetical protein [Desulfosporosinus sp. OT]EGW38788.1 hypothetical protein DOT_3257 [Desulfosporosinus sp. OT]